MMNNKKTYDVIIVGAGSMGMPAGYFLAREGFKTLLVDAFDPPHSSGSHHGDTRMIRHAYGEGRQYVPLVLRAQDLWYELEKETEQTIFQQTGVLGFGPSGSAFIDEAIASADKYSLPLEVLEAGEINKRWPGISLPAGYTGCFEPTSGILFSENCIRAYRQLALKYGAKLKMNTPVKDIEIYNDSVTIQTTEGSFTSEKLIISAGAWNSKILSKLGLDLPLQPKRQTVAWFSANETLYQSSTFPAFFADTATGQYYGFPSFGRSGVKIGRHDLGQKTDPDLINRQFGRHSEDEDHVRSFLQTYMPEAAGNLKRGAVCMYTKTPDDHFIVDCKRQIEPTF